MFAKRILLFTLFPQILAKESNTGEQDENILGWINERLHLDCFEKRIPKEEEFVYRQLSENGKGLERFVSSKWEQRTRNYTKVCNKEHLLHRLCTTQVTSFVPNEDVTHFDIERAPRDLNGLTTLCEFSSIRQGPDQTIIMRGRIKGYVNERIEMECPIRHRCNETDTVTLKMNLTEVKTVDISHKNISFPCRENDQYYKVCRDHMNSSYVNISCSAVMFVFERTPISLNNTHLHCHVKFKDVEVNSDHDNIETIIFLQYQQNESNSVTTPPTDKKISNESTTDSAPNTTSPPKESDILNGKEDKNGLSSGQIAGIVVGILILIILILIVAWNRERIRNAISRSECRRRRHAPDAADDEL